MVRRCLLATICLLASVSVVTAQTPPSQPSAPASTEPPSLQETMEDPQIGDHWTYEVRDDVSGDLKPTITHTVTDITSTEISVRLAVLGRPYGGYYMYDRAWDVINTGTLAFHAKRRHGHCAPLAVGKTWSFKSTNSNTSSGVSLKTTGSSKVTAKETLTIRAGTFEMFKIETSSEVAQLQRCDQEVSIRAADLVCARDQSLGEAHLMSAGRRQGPRQERCRTGRIRPALTCGRTFQERRKARGEPMYRT